MLRYNYITRDCEYRTGYLCNECGSADIEKQGVYSSSCLINTYFTCVLCGHTVDNTELEWVAYDDVFAIIEDLYSKSVDNKDN